MADQADGSIIIDTEINSDGFKAGSAELLAAIKALSTEVKNLGQTLKELFSKPLTPEINLADVAVEAPTAKAACALCKDWYFKTTGKNAFRPTTKLSDEDRKWYEDHNRIKHFDATLKQNGEK